MGIKMNGTNLQNISWGTQLNPPTQISLLAWIDITSLSAPRVILEKYNTAGTRGLLFTAEGPTIPAIGWAETASTANGYWLADVTTGRHHVAVTMDRSSVNNNPKIYIDGVSQIVTEYNAPSGTFNTDSSDLWAIGDIVTDTNFKSFDGMLYSLLVYDRILSDEEIQQAYATRLPLPIRKGLFFAPILWGCEGRQEFNGLTLTGTDLIYDPISRTFGTPAGSPVGYGDELFMIGQIP